MLVSRGADPVLRDDIVQEVAVRALDKQVPFTDPDDLYRWAAVTARNLHVDHIRYGGRMVGDEALLAVADGTDVAHAAERRVALGSVFRALAVMRPAEREAILDGLRTDGVPCTSTALVRRHRARATLRRAVGGMLVTLTTWRIRTRAYVDTVSPAMRTAGAAVMLPPVLAMQMGALAPAPRAPHRQESRIRVVGDTASAPFTQTGPVPVLTPAPPQPAPRPPRTSGVAPVPQGPGDAQVFGIPGASDGPAITSEPTPAPTSPHVACVDPGFDLPETCTPV